MICANRIMFVYSSKKLTNAMPRVKKNPMEEVDLAPLPNRRAAARLC